MTGTAPRAPLPHRRPDGRRGRRTVLGIPVSLVVTALVVSALLGVLLSGALEAATTGRTVSSSPLDGAPGGGSGNNAAGLPVVTESVIGAEVEELVVSGSIQPTTSFDAVQCLREQGSSDAVIIIEEVAWGPDQAPGWLIVHGPEDPDVLRTDGGVVSATVARPVCGSGSSLDPSEDALWEGTVLLGA